LPPAFAARLRAGLVAPLEDDLRADAPPLLRALEVERRLEEELVLRLRPPAPLAADFRAPPLELEAFRALDVLALRALDVLALRALDPDALRVDPLPDDLFRDDPPPLPEPDSAIALPPLKLVRRKPARCGRDYLMPSAEVTYA
jgi:hypothetical protein